MNLPDIATLDHSKGPTDVPGGHSRWYNSKILLSTQITVVMCWIPFIGLKATCERAYLQLCSTYGRRSLGDGHGNVGFSHEKSDRGTRSRQRRVCQTDQQRWQ